MRVPFIIVLSVLIAGCTKSNMDSQPKYHEYEPGALFRDGRVLQAPVEGTVARDAAAREQEAASKPAVDAHLLARGREQYNVYCSPCHDRTGAGRGMVVQRGMPEPPSMHEQRMLAAEDRHFYDVISNGFGAMYAHGDRIRPRDRWAIISYIRALQLSQHASLADLPDDVRAKLLAEKKP